MEEVGIPRAKLVELLWQLKLGYGNRDNGRAIHFNTLLRDSAYRREIIDEAAGSRDREIRQLGLSLRVLNVDGELTHWRLPREEAINPDIAETISRQQAGGVAAKSKLPLFSGIGMALLAVVASVFLFLDHGSGEVHISGSLEGEHLWSADKTWILDDIVYVEAGAKLTIEAGTLVKGAAGSALIVTRDASLMARGSAKAPIVFTSARPEGERQAGDWGGVVLLGNAPVNQRNAQIEGVPLRDQRGSFGGSLVESSCGVLVYARIEFAGYEVYANNELNGLTLGGCGRGTIIRHVQVHRALDDGIEVFGGNVDFQHVLVTGAGDDSLDWDMGWQGRVQFLLIVQYPGIGDNAIEADNNSRRHDANPISEPQIYNATLLSSGSRGNYKRGMTLRRGTGGHFHNVIISGFSREAIDIKDESTVSRLENGSLSFHGLLISNIGESGQDFFPAESGQADDDGGFDEAAYFARNAELGSNLGLLFNPARLIAPDFAVSSSSPAARASSVVPQEEFWDEGADFSGAVRPGSRSNWLSGWTAFPLN